MIYTDNECPPPIHPPHFGYGWLAIDPSNGRPDKNPPYIYVCLFPVMISSRITHDDGFVQLIYVYSKEHPPDLAFCIAFESVFF